MGVTATLLVVTLGVLLALFVWVIARKAIRDLDELRSGRVREDLRSAVAAGNADSLARAALGPPARQADLLAVLHDVDAPRRVELGRAVEASPAGPVVRATLERRLRSRRAPRRGLAALVLARLDLPYATAVVALAADPDADVRLTACAALEAIGTDPAAEALVGLLESDTLPQARVVERLCAPWAVAVVRRALADPAHERVRPQLLRALGLAGDRAAARDIVALTTDPELEVRVAAVRALGELRAHDAEGALRDALRDPAWPVRAQAAKALGRLRALSAAPALAEAMRDPAWWVRANAAEALGGLDVYGAGWLRRVAARPDRYARERAEAELLEVRRAA